jgi:hypothetical protein
MLWCVGVLSNHSFLFQSMAVTVSVSVLRLEKFEILFVSEETKTLSEHIRNYKMIAVITYGSYVSFNTVPFCEL